MPYIVNFTDNENKSPITVFDNTSSTDTSLTFPGRNVTGYGQIIAENFLSLLENFSSTNQPVNPVEGQLWYDSTGGTQTLKIWDNTAWKAASGIQKGVSQPSVETSKVGELWVDTTNQQLRIFTGTRWILVGPVESSVGGLRYGPVIEKISDSDNLDRFVLTFYIADIPVIIFSKDSFTPKTLITGFTVIKAGININAPATAGEIANFVGGFLPVLNGTARNAQALSISGVEVEAGKFLRSDVINTTNFEIKIKNNNGITIGADETFKLSTTTTSSNIYNSAAGSSIDLQTNRNGIPATVLRVVDNKIGINQNNPLEALDIQGNAKITGSFFTTNSLASTNLNNGSIVTQGGIAVAKNIIVGDGIDVTGVLQTNSIQPKITDLYDLGTSVGSTTKRWRTIRAKTIIADTIQGVLDGNISGNASTATALKTTTSFQLAGDVSSPAVQFDGQVGSATKILNATLTANIISGKSEPTPNRGKKGDFILTYRPSESSLASSGLLKQTRERFMGDLAVPIGAILPYAGENAPDGYLFCDGSEIERAKFSDLFDIIGVTYNGGAVLLGSGTFRLPDLRGRFALGRDNMDNAGSVPTSAGPYVDAGGGAAGRVPDVQATILGGAAGQSSIALTLPNLPEHSHTLSTTANDYAAIALTTTPDPAATPGLGPTAPGQAQYLKDSGGVKKASTVTLATPVGLMNPFLAMNYIIRSGPPAFITT
jgi:microcystin-dependent protein